MKELDDYYGLFPDTRSCNTQPWLTLSKEVYLSLSNLNPCILAKLVKFFSPSSRISDLPTAAEDMYITKWFKLHNPGESDECYFFDCSGNIKDLLSSIGMNLIDAPVKLCHQINKLNMVPKLQYVSRKSVINYYMKFFTQVYNGNSLPCTISSTKFKSVDNFVSFLCFLMTDDYKFADKFEEEAEFYSLGLLVTADEELHSLSDGRNIISSRSWRLFSRTKNFFVHENLQQIYHSDSKYILNLKSNVISHFNCIATILARNLPPSWKGATIASFSGIDIVQFQKILECLKYESFKVHSKELLENFTLIPANDGMVYSTASEVLPMGNSMNFLFRSKVKYDDGNEPVRLLLTKLHIPLIAHSILGDIIEEIDINLPSMFNPEDILLNLFLIKNDRSVFQSLSETEMKCLFNVLKLISYSPDINRKHLSQLPVFTTIDGHLVSLASASEIWIWSYKQVCTAGMNQWITHVPKGVILLDPTAAWSCLQNESKNLKMHNINKYDIYCRFIFPYFQSLNSTDQREHLKFIKDKIYPSCKESTEQSSNSKKVIEFVNALKSLNCIMDTSGTFRRIESFCDHTEPVYSTFYPETHFLPEELRGKEWQDFFKYFGLRVAPTAEEYISFCKKLPNLGDIRRIQRGSSVLLQALFSRTGTNIYKDIHSTDCLEKVSKIPIAIVEKNKNLHFIKNQKLGEHIVQDGTSTITLTKLMGSSPQSNQYLVWTVLPLVKLPVDFSFKLPQVLAYRTKQLGIVLDPPLKDVLSNLENLSTSSFASFSRFVRHSGNTISESSLLPQSVCAMLQYIQAYLKKQNNFKHGCNQLKPKLLNLSFLPVEIHSLSSKQSTVNSEEFALVQPTQVLCVDPSDVKDFYPFLHPLIEEASSTLQLLLNVGVCQSIKLSHIQHIMESAKNMLGDNEIDVNTRRTIVKATKQLIHLLQQTERSRETLSQLQNLYLLSEGNKLIECSKLFVNNVATAQPFLLPTGFAYLNFLTEDGIEHWQIEKLLLLLPKELGLKSLKGSLVYDMTDCEQADNIFPHISIIKDILVSSEFKKGVELFASNCIQGPTPPIVSDILTKFQANLDVRFLTNVHVQPKLKIDGIITSLNGISNEQFFLELSLDNCLTLNLRNDQDSYQRSTFQKLAKQLCSKLRLKSTDCFTITDDDELPELTSFVSEILQCKSISEVVKTINSYLPGGGSIQLETFTTVNEKPSLGDNIPEVFLEMLDQNFLNIFNPEEWVGYEIEHERIVYAQILHEINQNHSILLSDMQRMIQRRFLITVGNEEQIEVSVLEIYKLLLNKESAINEDTLCGSSLDVYDGPSSSEQSTQFKFTDNRKRIRDAVKAAWELPKEQRNKAIKRLYLQYHPDKNPDPNSTADFQYLQQVIEKMERGLPLDETDDQDMPQSYNSEWSSRFQQWNRTASSHRRFRSSNARASEGGMPGTWNIPNPHKDLNEAKRWIKQAEYDYAALCVLKTTSASNDKVCAATCFMSHEVAEKSLKAGMYAKCGLGQVSLANHNLVLPACQLAQLGCSVNTSDAELLENFYLNTRFPNRHPYPIVPGEKFGTDTAKQAFDAATRIYEVIMQLTENDD